MAELEMELTTEDVADVLSGPERAALDGDPQHLGIGAGDRARYVVRALLARARGVLPSEVKVAKYGIDLRFKGAPLGVGMEATVRLELVPKAVGG